MARSSLALVSSIPVVDARDPGVELARFPRFHADEASVRSTPLDQLVRELTAGKGYEPHHERHFADPCPTCRKPVSIRGCVAIEGALAFHAGCR